MIASQLVFLARSWLRTPFRLVTLLLGIGLAVALQHSMQKMNTATNSSFQRSIQEISGGADLVLQGGRIGVPEEALAEIQDVPGVKHTVPLIIQKAFLNLRTTARPLPLTILGVDLLNESSMRSYGGTGEKLVKDPLLFMSQVDSIAVTEKLAKLIGVGLEDKVPVSTSKGPRLFTVRALIPAAGVENTLDGVFAVLDIETARAQFGKNGKYDQVDIKLYDTLKTTEIAGLISAKLGAGFKVRPPSQQLELLKGTVAPVQSIFDFFGAASLIIAFFLVLNTAQTLASEKVYEIGLQRALGATRAQIFVLGIAQFALIGFLGSSAGVLISEFLTARFIADGDWAPFLESARVVLITTTIVLLASIHSAMNSAKITPVEAFRARTAPASGLISARTRGFLGAAFVSLSLPIALVAVAPEFSARIGLTLPAANACLALIVLGAAPFLCLLLVREVRRRLGPYLAHRLLMAIDSILIRPVNSVRVFKTLSFGFVLVFTIHFIRHAFEGAIDSKFRQSDRPDFVISLNGAVSDGTGVPMDEEVLQRAARVEGVEAVVAQRHLQMELDGKLIQLSGIGEVPAALTTDPYSYLEIVDTDPRTAGDAFFGPGHDGAVPILINRGFAALFGKRPGDRISLRTPSGERNFSVVALVGDMSGTGGAIYVALPAYRELWRDSTLSLVAVRTRKGLDKKVVEENLEKALPPMDGFLISTEEELRQQVNTTLDGSLKMLELTQILTLVIALISFASAFTVSIRSRLRELGLMRSLGFSKADVLGVSFLEVNFTTLAALAVSIACAGTLSKYFLALTLGPTLGWSLEFRFDPVSMGKLSLLILAVTLFAAVNAMLWAVKVPIREALKSE